MKIQGEFRTRKDYIGYIFYHQTADTLVLDKYQNYVINLLRKEISRENLVIAVSENFPNVNAEEVVSHVIETMSDIGLLSL